MTTTGIIDIETSPIENRTSDIKEIYCIALKLNNHKTLVFTETKQPFTDGTFKDFIRVLKSIDILVGHNIIKFDLPVLSNILGVNFNNQELVDTFILSKLMFSTEDLYSMDLSIPSMPSKLYGSASLKAFGYRLGENKIEYDDFSTGLNKEMVVYCKQDVKVTNALYKRLRTMDNYPREDVLKVETDFASIISKQENYGFYFDIQNARKLAVKLQFSKSNLEHKLQKEFPARFVPIGEVTPKTNREQSVFITNETFSLLKQTSSAIQRYKRPKIILNPITGIKTTLVYKPYKGKFFKEPTKAIKKKTLGQYTKIELQRFNPASRQQCIDRLQSIGWIADTYTQKGNPQLNEEILQRI